MMEASSSLTWIDWAIMLIYFVFVLGIGWALKKYMKNATDFLEAGRSLPAWITGLAFISANLGAMEVIGMAGSGAKYGMTTVHFYWVGAIPAMIFLALFMMPFFFFFKARSVPEYLKFRFNEKTRAINAFTFAIMTIFSSGAAMSALGKLCEQLFGWNFTVTLLISAAIILVYIYLGGLTSAIYNEVLQFFLIVIGFAPLVIIALKDVGGWVGMKENLAALAPAQNLPADSFMSSWKYLDAPFSAVSNNPMGADWIGIFIGLGFVLSFGYWCTNFLVVQRAMAADSFMAAKKTPLIGAVPKMFLPFLVIIPGIIALALTNVMESAFEMPTKVDELGKVVNDYDKIIPAMIQTYLPTGALGLGLTALMASFMSGMAGNVTAFNTIFTYDIYQSYFVKNKQDRHYFVVGQLTTFFGIFLSILAAFAARKFDNVMDFLQFIFAFVNAPLFATFLLGMFSKRTTGNGAFWGLLLGIIAAAIHWGMSIPFGADSWIKGGWLSETLVYPSEMIQNFWTAIFSFGVCFILTLVISTFTSRNKSDEDLKGLVYSLTPKEKDADTAWFKKPEFLAIVVGAIAIFLSILFW
ncbi:MAG: sodium:solute symporter family protein [Bacteroidales bacterium]|nr:sodium:solute symporter family protein [Bacteroidales bacterium]